MIFQPTNGAFGGSNGTIGVKFPKDLQNRNFISVLKTNTYKKYRVWLAICVLLPKPHKP